MVRAAVMAETIGRGHMKPSYWALSAHSIGTRGTSLQALFALIAILGAGMAGRSVLRAGELDAFTPVAEVRVVAGPASAAIEQELRSADRALLQAIAANEIGRAHV